MASGKKQNQGYDDALGSIFDFMFEEAEKPPEKRKPIKPTGLSGNSEFTEALATVLRNPAAFVGNTTMETLDGVLDEKMIQIQTSARGQDLDITTGNFAEFIKDPNKFMKKAYEKQKLLRKSTNIRWYAPSIQGVITSAYAKKIGLDDKDARLLGEATKKSLGDDVYARMAKPEGRKGRFYDMDYSLGKSAGQSNYNPTGIMVIDAKADALGKKPLDALDEYFGQKAADNPGDSEKFKKAQALVVDLKDQAKIRQSPRALSELRKEIKKLKRSNPNDPALKKYREDEKKLQVLVRQNNLGKIGQAEGIINAYNATYRTAKDLVPNILNGSFFDGRQHKNPYLTPSRGQKVMFRGREMTAHVAMTENTLYNKEVAKLLNELYYFTPAGIVSALTTGEAFTKRFVDRASKLQKSLAGLDSESQNLIKSLDLFDLKKGGGEIDITKLSDMMTDEKKMAELMKIMGDNPNNPIAKQLVAFAEKNQRLLKLADRFSWASKFGAAAQKSTRKIFVKMLGLDEDAFMKEKVGTMINAYIGKKLLTDKVKKFLVDKLGEELATKIGQEALAGGLKVMIKGLIQAALVAAGFATGGASILAWVGAEIVFAIGYKLVQYIILFILLVAIGVFATVTVGIYSAFTPGSSQATSRLAPHANLAPTQIEMCDAFIPTDTGDITPYTGPFMPGDPGTIYDGTVQEIYDQVAAELGIGTTLTLVSCPGDVGCDLIDWAWCYSGVTVYCRYDKLSGQSNNTLSRLFRHELLHQIQATGGGGAPSLLREWGADYLSGNGGGYRFQTPNGVLRATETKGALAGMGCSDDQLAAIARNEAGSLATGCGAAVQSYIQGFGAR